MTADDFRRIALALPAAIESAHMNHPDFRAAGKIFATLGYPDASWGMVNLSPEQQQDFSQRFPESFQPVPGGWGRRGSTRVRLESVNEAALQEALTSAWRRITAQPAARRRPKMSQSEINPV